MNILVIMHVAPEETYQLYMLRLVVGGDAEKEGNICLQYLQYLERHRNA
jgi:hypothetical protein